MNTINCVVPGCASKFETAEGIAPGARYVCRHHDRKTQLAAINREYDPVEDERDKEVAFQPIQFDPSLKRARIPIGTEHIKFQGSDVRGAEITNDDWSALPGDDD